jgi:hypothetical protein
MAEATGYEPLDVKASMFGAQTSKALFILGSGSSVNELCDEDFAHIGTQISIGLNVWLIHRFIPTAYSLEYETPPGRSKRAWERFEEILSSEELRRKSPKILHLRPSGEAKLVRQFSLPPELSRNSLIYGRTNLFSKSLLSLDQDVEALLWAYQRNCVPPNVLPDNGASVVRLIFLGLLQGFRTIVLVGVDLNSSPYFWRVESSSYASPENARDFPRPSETPHGTLDTAERPFRTDDVILSLARTGKKLFGARIFAGSTSSSLARTLPVYDWKAHREHRD